MSGDDRKREEPDILSGAMPEPDGLWPDMPDDLAGIVTRSGRGSAERLGAPVLNVIRSLDRGLWKLAVEFALAESRRGAPPDEIINSLLFGAFADFIALPRHDPPAKKADLHSAWLGRYVQLLRAGEPEQEARRRLRDALDKAHSRSPNIDPHFAGLSPYCGKNGKPPGRSTVDRWTAPFRRERT